jgi:hypothetical protein
MEQYMAKSSSRSNGTSYDVCLSFAGENRNYVDKVAHILQISGVRTFYDEFEKVSLWGKDLYSHLHDIYQNQASYCVVFISKDYAEKAWTTHERRSAQSRALTSDVEYILPVRFDDTKIPGIPETIGFIDLRTTSPEQLSDIIIKKIGPRPRVNYFPPIPDRLFKQLKIKSRKDQSFITEAAHRFFQALTRTTEEERSFIYDVFVNCCPAELPENVHISLDLLRRITGMRNAKIRRIASGMQSLGFDHSIRESHNLGGVPDDSGPIFVLEWHNRSITSPGNDTFLADAIIECATDNYCDEHAKMMFQRLDFGQLATSTTTMDHH